MFALGSIASLEGELWSQCLLGIVVFLLSVQTSRLAKRSYASDTMVQWVVFIKLQLIKTKLNNNSYSKHHCDHLNVFLIVSKDVN